MDEERALDNPQPNTMSKRVFKGKRKVRAWTKRCRTKRTKFSSYKRSTAKVSTSSVTSTKTTSSYLFNMNNTANNSVGYNDGPMPGTSSSTICEADSVTHVALEPKGDAGNSTSDLWQDEPEANAGTQCEAVPRAATDIQKEDCSVTSTTMVPQTPGQADNPEIYEATGLESDEGNSACNLWQAEPGTSTGTQFEAVLLASKNIQAGTSAVTSASRVPETPGGNLWGTIFDTSTRKTSNFVNSSLIGAVATSSGSSQEASMATIPGTSKNSDINMLAAPFFVDTDTTPYQFSQAECEIIDKCLDVLEENGECVLPPPEDPSAPTENKVACIDDIVKGMEGTDEQKLWLLAHMSRQRPNNNLNMYPLEFPKNLPPILRSWLCINRRPFLIKTLDGFTVDPIPNFL